jgi:polyferredoxin
MKRQRIRRKILFFAFLLFPIYLNYFSPALMTQGTAERVATASLFVWSAIFLTSLVVGRAFCGWGCPFHGIQMAWEKVADKPLKRIRYVRAVKYVLWAVWVGAVAAFAIATGGWNRVDLLFMTPVGVSVDSATSLITYYALFGITLLPMALGRRGFCHYICPFGVYGILGERIGHALRLPMLQLSADAAKCRDCKSCDKTCPMSLSVNEMVAREDMRATECILCGSCVDGCKRGAITYSMRKPAATAQRAAA